MKGDIAHRSIRSSMSRMAEARLPRMISSVIGSTRGAGDSGMEALGAWVSGGAHRAQGCASRPRFVNATGPPRRADDVFREAPNEAHVTSYPCGTIRPSAAVPTPHFPSREYAAEGSGTHGHQPQDARRSPEGRRHPRSALRPTPRAWQAGGRHEGPREGGAGEAQEAPPAEGDAPRAVAKKEPEGAAASGADSSPSGEGLALLTPLSASRDGDASPHPRGRAGCRLGLRR